MRTRAVLGHPIEKGSSRAENEKTKGPSIEETPQPLPGGGQSWGLPVGQSRRLARTRKNKQVLTSTIAAPDATFK